MEFSKSLPTEPGFYVVNRKGQDRTICNVWEHPETGMMFVAFAGRARGRTLKSVESVFPGAEYSLDRVDIGTEPDKNVSTKSTKKYTPKKRVDRVTESMIIDEDKLTGQDDDMPSFGNKD